jgi:magnesium transporter
MMAAYPTNRGEAGALTGCVWIDLVDPTETERAEFEKTFGLRVPTRAELAEIEATSRLRVAQDALYLTAPLVFAAEKGPWTSAPAGFVLSKHVLLTVRFANSPAFDAVGKEMASASPLYPALAFVRLLEELVDRLADLLEGGSHDLDDASHVIFRGEDPRRLSRESATLRQLMIRTGRTSERMSRIQYTLVCLDRISRTLRPALSASARTRS